MALSEKVRGNGSSRMLSACEGESSNIPQASDQLGSECNEVAFYRSLKSEVWILYRKYG